MSVKNSIQVFKIAAVVALLIIGTVSALMYSQITQSRQMELQLNRLQSASYRLLEQKDKFIQQRAIEHLNIFNQHMLRFENEYKELAVLLLDDPAARLQLLTVQQEVKKFERDFIDLQQLQVQLGFSANEGAYGAFRSSAHKLQSHMQSPDLIKYEVQLLELRRAEKDFLLRLEQRYLTLHQHLYEQMIGQLSATQQGAVVILAEYRQGFLDYIALLERQGYNDQSGIRGELEVSKRAVLLQLDLLNNSLTFANFNNKQNLLIFSLLTIVLVSVFSYVLLGLMHSQVSRDVKVINSVLTKVAEEENFNLRTQLTGDSELEQIGQQLDEMLAFIADLLTRLQAAQAKLVEEAKIASLGNIVNGFAHELNTPLGVAITSQSHLQEQIQQLKQGLESGKLHKRTLSTLIEDAQAALTLIENNLSRSSQLIEDFKMVAVHQQYDTPSEFNLLEQVNSVFQCFKSELPDEEFEITLDIPNNLNLVCFPSAINQILSLSISNSKQHGKITGKKLNIVVSAMVVNDFVHIYFKDDGAGIDKEVLPVIFEPFITSRHRAGGVGLGMSIIYNLVTQKLKGEVKVQSPAHGGACVHIILSDTEFNCAENDEDETLERISE